MLIKNIFRKSSCKLFATCIFLGWQSLQSNARAEEGSPVSASIIVDGGQTLRTMDPRRLGSSNVAMWYFPKTYYAPDTLKLVADLHPRYIRIPGGSWANGVYWNGHGVRGPDGKVDPSKVGPDGYPAVDYSDYSPSFLVDTKTLHPASNGWHGHTDVKTQHDWIKSFPGTEAMACPNAGTGRAVDAAEWVKWANQKMGYNVRMWEIGNELGGSWEAGTEMPLGKGPLTAEIYTARYNEMATAMRKMDPTIKIGSCPYVEQALRDCGENVDFVSIHTYPGSTTLSEAQMFSDIRKMVESQVGEVKGWIHKYQPNREKQIEIAYTEWNLSGGLDNGRLFSGLWSSIFLGEIAKNGVAMANQWDLFNDIVHDLGDAKKLVPKAEYDALWLWNNYMGDRLIAASSSNQTVYTYASRSDDALCVMLVNTNHEREANIDVQLSGFTPASTGEIASVSSREYYYNATAQKMHWSTGARIESLPTGAKFSVTLAPFSIAYLRIPDQSKPGLSPMAQKALAAKRPTPGTAELRFEVPKEMYAGDQVYGEVYAINAGSDEPFAGTLSPATLSADGDAGFDRKQVRLAEAVGHFTMKPIAPGELILTAQSGDTKATHKILVKPSVPRPIVFWDFSIPPLNDKETFSSTFSLNEDLTQRANRGVARVDLPKQGSLLPNGPDNHMYMLTIGRLPEEGKLNKSNIRGVIADVKTSPDFTCDDPNACILITMQGSANWWMKIGTIPLRDAKEWKNYQLDVKNEEYFKALPTAGNLHFVLQTSKPATGSVYFDKIGFMVR